MQHLADSISTPFDTMTTASGRRLSWLLYISWLRKLGASSFGLIGSSTINNCLLQGQTTALTPADLFEFSDETQRAITLEYDRCLEEPLGGISYSIMNVKLDNTDKRFTPNHDSTIGTALIPNRPVKMAIGFKVNGVERNLLVFKGLCDTPKENKTTRQVEFGGYDYISFLNDLQMDSEVYINLRSDEVIEKILIEAGLGTSQYILDEGLNTIGFAWFKTGMTAGERLRKICEAEEGNLYQDEFGIIRFENRRKYITAPYTTTAWTFKDKDILEWQQDDSIEIINKCTVKGTPREQGNKTEIWDDGMVETIAKNASIEIWAKFDNPCVSIDTPLATLGDYRANTASDGTGTDVTSGISIAIDSFTETAKLTITNNSGSQCYLTHLRLMGTPANIKSKIEQIYSDTVSIAKYGEKLLEVENDYIDSDSFAYYLARTIVRKYKDPLKRIKIRVRGVPHLQLKDKVSVYDRDLLTYKNYRVMHIQGMLTYGSFEQILTLREITDQESDNWAIVGSTVVDSQSEVLGI